MRSTGKGAGRVHFVAGFMLVMGPGVISAGYAATFPSRSGLPAPVLPECTCRFHGTNVPLGTRVCLVTPQGAHYARCVRELNVTSWHQDDETCAEARLVLPPAL